MSDVQTPSYPDGADPPIAETVETEANRIMQAFAEDAFRSPTDGNVLQLESTLLTAANTGFWDALSAANEASAIARRFAQRTLVQLASNATGPATDSPRAPAAT
jgi:hypothetical protein